MIVALDSIGTDYDYSMLDYEGLDRMDVWATDDTWRLDIRWEDAE